MSGSSGYARPGSAWALVDGGAVSPEALAFSWDGAALMHRAGLFETVSVRDGRPLRLGAHRARMQASALALGLGPTPPVEAWREDLDRLVRASATPDLAWRLVVLRERDRLQRLSLATVHPPAPGPARLGLAAPAFRSRGALARHKTLDWMGSRLALDEARARGLDEVLFAQPDGEILEGARSSLFLVERGRIVTPDARAPLLPGITRAEVLRLARELGRAVAEERIDEARLSAADEVFLTSSLAGIRPVAEFSSRRWSGPGAVTLELQGALAGAARRP